MHRLGVGRIGFGGIKTGNSGVARLYDGLECFALVLHVAFHCLDEVGNQIMATRKLNVDLRESVTNAVALVDEAVVNTDAPEDNQGNNAEED